jgi:RNA polymerase sigma factor (sigma-70 family)
MHGGKLHTAAAVHNRPESRSGCTAQAQAQPSANCDVEPAVDGPESYIMVRDEYRQVLAAMRHLEEDERDLLSLVLSSELSYRELAEMTGLSKANVKVKIHRARKKPRAHLGTESR